MISLRASLAFVLCTVLAATPALASHVHRSSGSGHRHGPHQAALRASSRRSSIAVVKEHRLHGQQAIDSDRVMEIQQALIREHYLTDEASGRWDSTTESAMQKFQADQGWQTKLMPDPRAIKKLGLGPDYSGAINAKDANFGDPPPVSSIPSDQASGFARGAGINR